MENLLLKSTKRFFSGKRSNKILRRKGLLPCILYKAGVKPISLSIKFADIQNIIRANPSRLFFLDLDIEGEKRKVTIKELQRHPVSGDILHMDFYEVTMDRKIKVSVPIKAIGDSIGVKSGGMLQIIDREIDIICFPKDIPAHINIDITNLNIGDSIHIKDVFLSEDIKILGEPSSAILTVLSQKKSSNEDSAAEISEIDESEDEQI